MKAPKIIEWLKQRPLISIYGLEKVTNCPEGTIAKAVKGVRPLGEQYVEAILLELKKYGCRLK